MVQSPCYVDEGAMVPCAHQELRYGRHGFAIQPIGLGLGVDRRNGAAGADLREDVVPHGSRKPDATSGTIGICAGFGYSALSGVNSRLWMAVMM